MTEAFLAEARIQNILGRQPSSASSARTSAPTGALAKCATSAVQSLEKQNAVEGPQFCKSAQGPLELARERM